MKLKHEIFRWREKLLPWPSCSSDVCVFVRNQALQTSPVPPCSRLPRWLRRWVMVRVLLPKSSYFVSNRASLFFAMVYHVCYSQCSLLVTRCCMCLCKYFLLQQGPFHLTIERYSKHSALIRKLRVKSIRMFFKRSWRNLACLMQL